MVSYSAPSTCRLAQTRYWRASLALALCACLALISATIDSTRWLSLQTPGANDFPFSLHVGSQGLCIDLDTSANANADLSTTIQCSGLGGDVSSYLDGYSSAQWSERDLSAIVVRLHHDIGGDVFRRLILSEIMLTLAVIASVLCIMYLVLPGTEIEALYVLAFAATFVVITACVWVGVHMGVVGFNGTVIQLIPDIGLKLLFAAAIIASAAFVGVCITPATFFDGRSGFQMLFCRGDRNHAHRHRDANMTTLDTLVTLAKVNVVS
jgi:hypothetical protein